MCAATAANSEIGLLVSVYQNFGKSVSQTEFKDCVAWCRMRPSVFFVMGDYQSSSFGCFLEPSVVVSIASTAILNAQEEVVIMNHFVKKRCDNLFYWSCERSSSNVDFVRAAKLGNPSVFVK